jgi:hypothetical protein
MSGALSEFPAKILVDAAPFNGLASAAIAFASELFEYVRC